MDVAKVAAFLCGDTKQVDDENHVKETNIVGRSCRKLRRSMELTCALARGFHSYRWSFIRVGEKYCSHEIIVCVFVFKKKSSNK